MDKNLYQICKNKVTVNLSVSYKAEDITKLVKFLMTNATADYTNTMEIVKILTDVRTAVSKALLDANGADLSEDPNFGPDCRPFANI
jgi:hypothetical protein